MHACLIVLRGADKVSPSRRPTRDPGAHRPPLQGSTMVFHSAYEDVPAVSLPIHDAVLGRAAEYGDTPALVDGSGAEGRSPSRTPRSTPSTGASPPGSPRPGSARGRARPAQPQHRALPVAFYAATRAGAAVTTVHPLATPEEFAKQLRDSSARWIVTVSPLLPVARAAAELAGGIERSSSATSPRRARRSARSRPSSAPPDPSPPSRSTPTRTSPPSRIRPARPGYPKG